MIRKDVQRGPYKTVDEFVEYAVQMLHEQEEWLSANRAEIGARIDEGYAAAQRGELIEGDQVREQMAEKKRTWLSDRKPPGMTLYRFTPQASDDLLEIWRYIAADSREAADRVENSIYDACTLIAQSPSRPREALTIRIRPVNRLRAAPSAGVAAERLQPQ